MKIEDEDMKIESLLLKPELDIDAVAMPGRFNYAQNMVPPCSFDYGLYKYSRDDYDRSELNNAVDVLYSARGTNGNSANSADNSALSTNMFDLRAAVTPVQYPTPPMPSASALQVAGAALPAAVTVADGSTTY